jgi:hypothetical protein
MGKRSISKKGVGKLAPLSLMWLKHYLSEGADTFLNGAGSARAAGYRARNQHTFEELGHKNRVRYAAKISEWLDQCGMGETQLKVKLLSLFEARETVFVKLRGAVLQSDLPPGHRVVATTGTVVKGEDGRVYGDGDSLLEIDVQNYGVQVKSLEMALKVKGLFTPENHEHSGTVATTLQLTDEDRTLLRKAIDASVHKLMQARREVTLQLSEGAPQAVRPSLKEERG